MIHQNQSTMHPNPRSLNIVHPRNLRMTHPSQLIIHLQSLQLTRHQRNQSMHQPNQLTTLHQNHQHTRHQKSQNTLHPSHRLSHIIHQNLLTTHQNLPSLFMGLLNKHINQLQSQNPSLLTILQSQKHTNHPRSPSTNHQSLLTNHNPNHKPTRHQKNQSMNLQSQLIIPHPNHQHIRHQRSQHQSHTTLPNQHTTHPRSLLMDPLNKHINQLKSQSPSLLTIHQQNQQLIKHHQN